MPAAYHRAFRYTAARVGESPSVCPTFRRLQDAVTIDLTLSESPENAALAELLGAIADRRIRRKVQKLLQLGEEAVRAVVRFGHERIELNRIEAVVMLDNGASVRVLRAASRHAEAAHRRERQRGRIPRA